MAGHLEAHPLFERVSEEELVRVLINSVSVTYSSLPDRAGCQALDPTVPVVQTYTEEGKKVERNQGSKHLAVFRRIAGGSKRKRVENQ